VTHQPGGSGMMETVATVFGVEIRTCDAYPRDVVGFSSGRVVVYYWEGVEVARLSLNDLRSNVMQRLDREGGVSKREEGT